jgi:hypothetical protein
VSCPYALNQVKSHSRRFSKQGQAIFLIGSPIVVNFRFDDPQAFLGTAGVEEFIGHEILPTILLIMATRFYRSWRDGVIHIHLVSICDKIPRKYDRTINTSNESSHRNYTQGHRLSRDLLESKPTF